MNAWVAACRVRLAVLREEACRARDTTHIRFLRTPTYVFNIQEYISAERMLILIRTLCAWPKLDCLGAWTQEYYDSDGVSGWRAGADHVRGAYGALSAAAVSIFFLRIKNRAVLNNTLTSHVTTAGLALKQVALLLFARGSSTLASACTVPALMETDKYFKGTPT